MRGLAGLMAASLTLAFAVHPSNAQETRLLLTSFSPAGRPNSQFFNNWAKRVTDASNELQEEVDAQDTGSDEDGE